MNLHVADPQRAPSAFPGSPLAGILKQPLFLGLFLPIQAGGWSPSALARSTDWSFDYNSRLTLKADLDHPRPLRAVASSASGQVRRHARPHQRGAVGHEMFGWDRIEHDRRYELAAEFIEVLQRLWQDDENFSFAGQSSWKLNGAFVTPKPRYGRPVLINATGSEAGISFAGRYSDIVFITSPAGSDIDSALEALPAHTKQVKDAALGVGRRVRARQFAGARIDERRRPAVGPAIGHPR